MRQIEKFVHAVKWVLHTALVFVFVLVFRLLFDGLDEWVYYVASAFIGAGLILFLNDRTGKLLWLIRDFAKSEFERGRNTNQSWTNFEER